jgi:hypothetical protein
MKRHILKDNTAYPNRIYGLVCVKPFTQLVWNLGESLDLAFTRDKDVISEFEGNSNQWPCCSYTDLDFESTFSVVKNKGAGQILAGELKNVDAFLIETNHSLTFQLSLEKVSKTRFVDFCFEVKQNMINEETNLLLHLE